ncbi:MAG: NUDIX domain-containing protein [Nanoarchaeota archaeon]|nr:NUDIX domain-containing protein [Nanoarchaeota archaeon]
MRNIVKAIIYDSSKFLILKRTNYKGEKNANKWDLPGGSVDHGENFLSAITRECLEETNLTCTNVELESTHGIKDIFDFHLYSMEYVGGDITLSHEHSDFKWISCEELDDFVMCSEKITLENIKKFMKKN